MSPVSDEGATVVRGCDRGQHCKNRVLTCFLSWLHKEATVQQVDVVPEAGVADVTVIISGSSYGKFRKLFPE